jgi:hypothetical protein
MKLVEKVADTVGAAPRDYDARVHNLVSLCACVCVCLCRVLSAARVYTPI